MKNRRTAVLDADHQSLARSDPDLLALADALAVTMRSTQRERGLTRVAYLAFSILLAAVFLLAGVALPWRDGSPTLIERAQASVGAGDVLHVVVETERQGNSIVDLTSGAVSRPRVRVEYWIDRQSDVRREMVSQSGVVLTDEVRSGGYSSEGPTGSDSPAVTAALLGYESMLRSGRAVLRGRERLGGRSVVWVRAAGSYGTSDEIAIDEQTGLPIVFRTIIAGDIQSAVEWRVRSVESVDDIPASSPAADTPGAFASKVVRDDPVTLSEASGLLGERAVWLGPTFAGMELERLGDQRIETWFTTAGGEGSRRIARGLEITYRSRDAGGASLVLRESLAPQLAYGFGAAADGTPLAVGYNRLPQPGTVDISVVGSIALGQLLRGGVFVTVTGGDIATVERAARSLRDLR